LWVELVSVGTSGGMFENCDEPLDLTKGGEYLDWLSEQLFILSWLGNI
jgi:hypothetical protein